MCQSQLFPLAAEEQSRKGFLLWTGESKSGEIRVLQGRSHTYAGRVSDRESLFIFTCVKNIGVSEVHAETLTVNDLMLLQSSSFDPCHFHTITVCVLGLFPQAFYHSYTIRV